MKLIDDENVVPIDTFFDTTLEVSVIRIISSATAKAERGKWEEERGA